MTSLVLVCGMSRSGTTLLATMLDSHPEVSMGYELLPSDLPPAPVALALLAKAGESAGGDTATIARLLDHQGYRGLSRFVKRCRRALVDADELAAIIARLAGEGTTDLTTIAARAALARAVVETKRAKEGTRLAGFKLNSPSIAAFAPLLGDAAYVYIVRDPRDVMASHLANDFDRTAEQVGRAWCNYLARFQEFAATAPGRTLLIRYEDLVCQPAETVAKLARWLGLDDHAPMLDFVNSKASIHQGGHVNRVQIERDFFTSSVGRWTGELDRHTVDLLQGACAPAMKQVGYVTLPNDRPAPLPEYQMRANRWRLAAKKRFHRDDYQRLVEPWVEGRTVLTLVEAMGRHPRPAEKLTYVRHDIDHDIESAVTIGRWEHEHGLRSTFCVLHTAWYYGTFDGRHYHHSAQMIDACLDLQDLGHEINLHNNFVTLGLEHGIDPVELLHEELSFLRRHGVSIRGTSAHGDALCRELDYFNLELFKETPWPAKGGRRIIRHKGNQVELGVVPMSAFGVEYEAYDLPREIYVTDSGGRPRLVRNTRGRGGVRRQHQTPAIPFEHVVGILTHPEYWDMSADSQGKGGFPLFTELETDYEARQHRNRAREAAER